MTTKEEIPAAEAERQEFVKKLIKTSSSPAKCTACENYTARVRGLIETEVKSSSGLEIKLVTLQAEPPKKEGGSLKRLFGKKMANPDDSTAQALSISKGLRGKLEKREKTVKELEALMNKHLGIQMALDGQAAFEGWFGTPDHPEHEAAMASTFKARDACDKIVMEQFYISYSQDALSKAEKSLGQVLSQFTKALDASNSIKGRKNLPSTATKQDLAEVWVWLKLASLPASDASNIVDTSTVEQALLTEPMLGDSARIKEYHTKFEHLRSLAQGRTNDLSEKQKTLALESATTHEAVGTGLTAIQDLRWNMFLDKVDRPEGTDTAQG